MSATQVPLQPIKKGSLLKLWLGILLLIAAGVALARVGTMPLDGETTESGTFVRTLAEGEGEPLQADDGVFLIYTGTLEDGTEFDSSNGQPVPFLVQGLIPGFSEALLKMREGGKYKIKIPGEEAYGSSPPPGSPIPPDADLLFDIEIVQIVRDAANTPPPSAVPQPEPMPGAETPPAPSN